MTVEQNVILPKVDEPVINDFLKDDRLAGGNTRLQVDPGMIGGYLRGQDW